MQQFRKAIRRKVGQKSDGKATDTGRNASPVNPSPMQMQSQSQPQIHTATPPISAATPAQASRNESTTLPLSLDPSGSFQHSLDVVSQASTINVSVPPAQHQETQPGPGIGTVSPPTYTGQNKAFGVAVRNLSEKLDRSERKAFLEAYLNITPEQTLVTIKQLDDTDVRKVARRGARSLGPAIQILEQFMAGVSIGIQQSPEISSLVIGGVRLAISLITRFIDFYNKLSEMICFLGDYLAPLEVFSRNGGDDTIIQDALVGIYGDLIEFFQEVRLVFVNRDGSVKKLGAFRTFLRVQWQPFADKFGDIKSRFVHHLSVLQTSAQAQQLYQLSHQFETLKTGFTNAEIERRRVQSKELLEDRRKFLEWISKVNPEVDFDRIIKQRHPNTGTWFLEHDSFKKWADKPDSGLLWCHGTPGAGKSVLASVALDHLTKHELNKEKTCVIFAYYSYRHPERDDPSKLVASFIKQLCSKLDRLPDKVQFFFRSNFYDDRTPFYEDMESLLFELLEAYSRVFIIIDALDECQAPTQEKLSSASGRGPKYRQEVLDFVSNLASGSAFCAKVLVTSRREEDIKDAFHRGPVIEIDAAQVNVDIKAYLHDEIELRVEKKTLKLGDPKIKDHIFSTLASRAQGMFLWVTLQLDWICQQRGDDDILYELECLPQDLCESYDRILERLSQQPPRLREVARRALMWVLYALEPLTMNELIEAIAIEPSVKSYNDLRSKTREQNIIISCMGTLLAPVQSNYDAVRLIHTSAHEYLTSTGKDVTHPSISDFFIQKELAHGQLASSCMTFLQLDTFDGDSGLVGYRYLHTLAFYSARFFEKHIMYLNRLPQEIYDQINKLLDSSQRRFAFILQLRYGSMSQTAALNATTLICATDLFHILQSHRPDSGWLKLTPLKSSLHLAAGNGSVAAMEILVDMGQEIDELDDDNTPPIYYSSVYGHFTSTKWLIDQGACVDMYSEILGTALQAASAKGHLAIVELLLKHNADVNLQGGEYSTALQAASARGYSAIVELLLKHNADVNLQGGEYGTALQAASARGYSAIVELLLKHNADVNLQGGEYGTALQAASARENLAIVELLLKHNADVNLQGGHYGTALQAASARGYSAIVELLLKHNADVNLQGGEYGTALQAASARGYSAIVELLLKHNADVNLQGGEYGTALQAASARGYSAIVELLLKHNADVNLQGGHYGTALQAASARGYSAIVELLLKHNADVNLQGGEYGTALQAASARENLAIVELLLKHNADINLQGGYYSTALQAASAREHLAIVELLLKHNADVNLQGGYYGTALQAASAREHLAIVELLLSHSANITSRSLELACDEYCKNDAVASLLLSRGTRVTKLALKNASRNGWKSRYEMLVEYKKRQDGDAGQSTSDSEPTEESDLDEDFASDIAETTE